MAPATLTHNKSKIFNPTNLFEFDATEQKIILNRSIGFLDYLENFCAGDNRGICFDDSTHNYLKNQNVGSALEKIYTTLRRKQDRPCFL